MKRPSVDKSKVNRLVNYAILILGILVVVCMAPEMISLSLSIIAEVVRFFRNYISYRDLFYSGSVLCYLLFYAFPSILACVFLTYWAVVARKRITLVLGSIFWVIPILQSLTRADSPLFIVYMLLFLCPSVVLLFAAIKEKRNKVLLVIPFIVITAVGLLEIIFFCSTIRSWSSDLPYVGIAGFLSNLAYYFKTLFFVAFGIYILIDGKPFEKKTALQRQYLQKKTFAAESLTEQLNQIKADYEAGRITEDEYKKLRMELLRKAAK